MDENTTVGKLREVVDQFVQERDWQQFHTPKNLVMALSIEVSELMEHFQWISNEESQQVVHDDQKRQAITEERYQSPHWFRASIHL